eukprot:CAMPEP_0116921364 /NCGR_PEP_ID=MMETSP0467-20121206/21583_1 /TAXON_ID=283647 /ORGANISM="Mesodinium pulex, Strain SPMC105" /LENGTH=65 /DNA_ID=CAMNT_0004599411 /DNA_START=1413 /DNA_END=1610 /DNA_ORIENTATION=+
MDTNDVYVQEEYVRATEDMEVEVNHDDISKMFSARSLDDNKRNFKKDRSNKFKEIMERQNHNSSV